MSLVSEYKRQFGWRNWTAIFKALPLVKGELVLDLGCGVGDLAAEFVARGARVIGIDMNEELLNEARFRGLANAEFQMGDVRSPPNLGIAADGIWCIFTAAFIPDLVPTIAEWTSRLKPNGWIALTEVDDLFGHEPLSSQTRSLLNAYADDALAAGRYDFRMGRKLEDYLKRAGFTVLKTLQLDDQELSFSGPARPDVVDAWRTRFQRMKLLRDFCGAEFELVQTEFLDCLTRVDHGSTAAVYCFIATKAA
jgi:SAM-dependent methyltransferase